MGYEVSRMLPRHFTILDMCLSGQNNALIAQSLDMTPQAISLIINSPIFQTELARRRKDIEKQTNQELANMPTRAKQLLEENSYMAAQVHVDLCNPINDPKIRQVSASVILDRVMGDGKNQSHNAVVMIGNDALEILRQALAESNGHQVKVSNDSKIPETSGI